MREVVSRCRGVDMILFLGDGLRDLSVLDPEMAMRLVSVRGNCDGFSFLGDCRDNTPEERFLALDSYHILMMHGHTHGVKGGMTHAVAYAAARGADLLLFGHTHEPTATYLPKGTAVGDTVLAKPMYVFNPGSLGAPRSGEPSYGRVDLLRGGIVCSHGNL